MNQDTFIHRNVDHAHIRYEGARKTLIIKARELRPLRRVNRIPLWRDLETQFVCTALNRRHEYYEALRIRDAVTLVIARRNEQIDQYLAPHLTIPGDVRSDSWVIGVALGLLALVAVFCGVGVCI